MYTAANVTVAALLGVLLVLLAIIGVRAWRRSRVTPEQKEHRRRRLLVATGKMGDARLLDIQSDLLMYSYDVRGAEYTASQDISALRAFLPADVASWGHVLVKYDPRNPANSIVLAEDWNGFVGGFPAPANPAPRLSPRE
ncbi:MAG TPA: hypothetical protein VMI94_28390 [Bryobacteraceae bacterium]|nr:hypothetical protein [Bryobacteraceae bacterium]